MWTSWQMREVKVKVTLSKRPLEVVSEWQVMSKRAQFEMKKEKARENVMNQAIHRFPIHLDTRELVSRNLISLLLVNTMY